MRTTVVALSSLLIVSAGWIVGLSPRAVAADAEKPAADLFEARDRGELGVRFVPSSEKKGVLTLSNPARSPLAVRVPDALGARPAALAQFMPAPQFPQRRALPQAMGLALPAGAEFRLAAWTGDRTGRVVQIPPRGEVRVTLLGVCLQYGHPTPNARMKYELVPLSQVTQDPRVAAALGAMADGSYVQPAVQLAAWHLANGKTLASLRSQFSAREMKAAEALLRQVSAPERAAPATPAPRSQADKSA